MIAFNLGPGSSSVTVSVDSVHSFGLVATHPSESQTTHHEVMVMLMQANKHLELI